jgi:hypothetical protein
LIKASVGDQRMGANKPNYAHRVMRFRNAPISRYRAARLAGIDPIGLE